MLSSKPNFKTNILSENNFIPSLGDSNTNSSAKATKKSSKHGNRKARNKDGGTGKATHTHQKKGGASVRKNVRFMLPPATSDKLIEVPNNEINPKQKPEKDRIPNHKSDANVLRHLTNGWHTKWKPKCPRWVARLEHLLEMDLNCVKLLPAKPPIESLVRFCDNQRHLLLGNGPDFSTVYMGILSDGTEVAVKKINIKRAPLLLDMNVTKAILAAPTVPLLTKTHFITRDKTHFYVVKDLGEYSLKQELKRLQYLLPSQKQPLKTSHLCHEIAKAVGLLHSHNLIHMSLKPENVIVNASGQGVMLTDYGLHARIPPKQQQKGEASRWVCWLPYEIVANHGETSKKKVGQAEKYTTASDVASLGMLFYYIMTEGGHPFGDHDDAPETCTSNIKHGSYNLKAITDPYAHHLVKNMIFKEPEKRFTIDQVIEHPYFWSGIDRDQYVSILSKVAVSAYQLADHDCAESLADCHRVLDQLKANESMIFRSYVNSEGAVRIPSQCMQDIDCLLAYICRSVSDEFQNGENTGDLPIFWKCLPGLLLSTYSEASLERLQSIYADLKESGKISRLGNLLQPMLSTDSGIPESPDSEISLDFAAITIKQHPSHLDLPSDTHRIGRYSSADDGIDVVTPIPGSLIDDGVFFTSSASSLSSSPAHHPNGWNIPKTGILAGKIVSPGSCCSSVDNHFEFDRGDCSQRVSECDNDTDVSGYAEMPLWTDIDELD